MIGQILVKKFVMTKEQFREFMKDKICYHHQCFWIEQWQGSVPIEEYIPMGSESFILSNEIELRHYPYKGYSEKCKDIYSIKGKRYWEYQLWRASISDKNKKIYIREYKYKED